MTLRSTGLATLALLSLATAGCYDSTGAGGDAGPDSGIVIRFDGATPRLDGGGGGPLDAGPPPPPPPRDAGGPRLDGSSPTREGAVGSGCETDEDCTEPPGATCTTMLGSGRFGLTLPGGYCSAECTAGSDSCGEGAECFSVGFGGFGFALCMKSCFRDSDCRTDEGYTCAMPPFIGGGPYCLPPQPMPGGDGGFTLPDASFSFPDASFSLPDASFTLPDAGI